MLYSELIKGAHTRLKVDKEKSKDNFFTLLTDDIEDLPAGFTISNSIPKLKFQTKEPIPDYLDIYVKDNKDGYIFVGQDLTRIIPRFYSVGEEYLFKIKGKKIGRNGAYEVEDENGLYFTLNKAPEGLTRGKTVKCKVLKINNVYVLLKYSGLLSQKIKLQFKSLQSWLEVSGCEADEEKISSLLSETTDLSPALEQLEAKDSDWIFTLLHLFSQNVTKFLIEAKDSPERMDLIRMMMKWLEQVCMYIIQRSGYLRDCNPDQRAELQETLSGYIEMFRQYEKATALISENKDEVFIDTIFEDLKQAGFLYHPSEQFRIMMTILRLRPDLIKSRLNNLFEALHSWPVSTWKADPFRSALVDQLEIYISENCEHLNSVPMSETQNGSGNQQLTHLVRSIAIQSLLATPYDRIDLAHNKSMFYRFLSNFRTRDVDDLLYKAVGSLLGHEYKGDFSWEDTSRFQLLQEKASTLKNSNIDISLPPKVYTLQNAIIELRLKELTVRERYATDDNSVLPNGLISWMSPKIMLTERVRTPNASKKNDLKAYEEMWGNIENCLFPASDPDATTEIDIKKVRPEDGDEVEIIIDDCKFDPTASEGHKLKFHCVVVSDEYEGSGWLTACTEDFVAWLDEKDFPRNYNGDLDIFCDERGVPLIFPATVKNSGKELYFTMKKDIKEALAEAVELNEESQAVIRHVDYKNRRYVCLSDKGYTLLVDMDEQNGGYSTGTVVRVKYLGMNHYTPDYWEGEIVEYVKSDDCYTKVNPLRSIMQTLGRQQEVGDEEADSEVIEAQEVMSREEMREIILMLQRRAYAEKEYLQAFNYLGLAALLAKAIDDDSLRAEIKLHQRLLAQLQYYARNREVNHEELAKHKDQLGDNDILKKLYTKLDIVASIARPERNNHLWELTTQEDETERLLASLVLSLNMLPEEESYEVVRKNINSEIAKVLNVNSAEKNLKYYGEEDQHMEFKSSLVFTNKKEDHMAARREAQEREILEIICGFLNSEGGYLYIGVNDLGYEAGLAEDLRYRRSRGRKATLDGMIVDLENLIHRNLPGAAQDHIRIMSDPEAEKGVIKVEVDAVERPVVLDGNIFVRHSTSTRPKLGKDLDDFIKMRSENYRDFKNRQLRNSYEEAIENNPQPNDAQLSPTASKNSVQELTPQPSDSAIESGQPTSETSAFATPASTKIATGTHRPNILHNWEDGYVHPVGYIYFYPDSTFDAFQEDKFKDLEEEGPLALAILENEVDDMLIATFEDGTVCRIPVKEILEMEPGVRYDHWNGSKLTAVNIAPKGTVLTTFLVAESNEMLYVRMDTIEDLPLSHKLKTGGKRLTNNDYHILRQEICKEESLTNEFPKIAENSKKMYGSPMKFSFNHSSFDESINYYINIFNEPVR